MAGKPVKPGRLESGQAVVFVCDIQERFRNVASHMPTVIDTVRRLMRGAEALHVPVVVTEQYPAGLGHTVVELRGVQPNNTLVVSKTAFTMLVPEVQAYLSKHPKIKQVILCGIEAHVCVFQTALDCLERGYEVHLIVDGVSAQYLTDRAVGIQRIAQAGAHLASAQMVLFQMAGNAKHPAFKTISALAKETRAHPLPIVSNL
ncbi:hypothetical protein WJX73_009314 [Symbiochloris irregularis]|uniref:Isochorismatase-like domain-containing protein n=1 Tax=Symbiochloris irregularis TaxID=706552 RepID=A0AAW1P3G6_9CHLO